MNLRTPGEGGFTLITPEDRLISTPDGTDFESVPKFIPGIGSAHLYGMGNWETPLLIEHLSMGIVDGHLRENLPDEYFYDLGLYHFQFVFQPGFLPKIPLLTRMTVPKFDLLLEGEVHLQDDETEPDSTQRYNGDVFLWRKQGIQTSYAFFVPKDALFLSGLRFSLSSVSFGSSRE